MFGLTSLFGTRNERILKDLRKRVKKINALESKYSALSDEELKAVTPALKARLADGEALDSLLEDAFAAVRESAVRALRMRHYDEQLLGGMVLHMGKIAEMGTGEGKTLVATLPAYLNALTGHAVHVVTVNDYLAKRDAEWMRPVYEGLGLKVGYNISGLTPEGKREAYTADVTYGTNSEFGFDYLRDNMVTQLSDRVQQKEFYFAIVDEVDSILIDEARTPLVISGHLEDSSSLYLAINAMVPKLTLQQDAPKDAPDGHVMPGDFTIDRKSRQVYLTEAGHTHAEALFMEAGLISPQDDLYSAQNILYLHHLSAALRAHHLYARDVDYMVAQDGEIVIVDEHTGRAMAGRRWSEGLHQAIEAKEGVEIQSENQTLASVTYQNFFRIYDKLAGMTGTADTEAAEFHQIYGLEVVVMPPHKPCIRKDSADLIYQRAMDKYEAMIIDIKARREHGQPVLVGTTSIENSELLSKMMKKAGIPHQVLNAKYHEHEAHIIMEAGKPGTVTIATNMAGRGTDIVLGGNLESEMAKLGPDATQEQIREIINTWEKRHEDVVAAGGLHVMGSERHESRRIDNQLRGRAARQGDPGSSQFYLSLEDPLLKIFANEWVTNTLGKLGLKEEERLESHLLSRSIEKAQRRVEAYHFDVRKNLLEFDDVINEQRRSIYSLRDKLIMASDLAEYMQELTAEVLTEAVNIALPSNALEETWDAQGLQNELFSEFAIDVPIVEWVSDPHVQPSEVAERVIGKAREMLAAKEAQLGPEIMRRYERMILLQMLDTRWRENLAAIDYIRQNVGLRGFAQKDPRQEFKRECYNMFTSLLQDYRRDAIRGLLRFQISQEQDLVELEKRRRTVLERVTVKQLDEDAPADAEPETISSTVIRSFRKMGRNETCFCGSGKKYKHCHGELNTG
ncbi:MAG: preprotein translocase subunit SecA [Gammaproteobacteria bacterium]